MEFLTHLWMPIVISAVVVFIASAVLWMVLPFHKKDFTPPPDEASIQNAIRTHGFKPGMYFIPWCRGGDMKDPALVERMKAGPWAMMIVPDGMPNFGRSLAIWFVNCLVIAAFVGYVASHALAMGTPGTIVTGVAAAAKAGVPYLKVFQLVGAVTFLAHAGMAAHDTIWKGLSWRHAIVKMFDGLVYACLTAGIFGWLWPR